jgi:hypothetical protein
MWWSGLGRGQPSHDVAGAERGRGQPSHDVAGAERGLVRREKRPASIGATARRVLPVPGERLQRLTGAPCYFVVDGRLGDTGRVGGPGTLRMKGFQNLINCFPFNVE